MTETYDTLVIGSGISALAFALEVSRTAADAVTLVTKRDVDEANTRLRSRWASRPFSGSPTDSFDAHVEDTLRAGAGLCRREVVERVVREGPEAIRRLIELRNTVRSDRRRQRSRRPQRQRRGPRLRLRRLRPRPREGGHSHRRVLHAGDITGAEVMRGLLASLRSASETRSGSSSTTAPSTSSPLDARRATSSAVRPSPGRRPNNRVLGAYVLDEETGRGEDLHRQERCMLAAGGRPRSTCIPRTQTSRPATASLWLGARERRWRTWSSSSFTRPVSLPPEGQELPYLGGAPRRGRDPCGARTAPGSWSTITSSSELAPRDIVARAIDTELKRTGDDCVFLDMTHLDADFLTQGSLPQHSRDLPRVRHRSHQGAHSCRSRRPLRLRRRCAVTSTAKPTFPGLFVAGEVVVHGHARRQPAGVQQPARGRGLRSSRRLAGADRSG